MMTSFKHYGWIFFFLACVIQIQAQTTVKLQAPESIHSDNWAEIQLNIQNTYQLKHAYLYIRMPDQVQVEALENAKGLFDHAFNGIRIEWNQLQPGYHQVRFRIKTKSQEFQHLRLNAILTAESQNQTTKAESGEQIIKVL